MVKKNNLRVEMFPLAKTTLELDFLFHKIFLKSPAGATSEDESDPDEPRLCRIKETF